MPHTASSTEARTHLLLSFLFCELEVLEARGVHQQHANGPHLGRGAPHAIDHRHFVPRNRATNTTTTTTATTDDDTTTAGTCEDLRSVAHTTWKDNTREQTRGGQSTRPRRKAEAERGERGGATEIASLPRSERQCAVGSRTKAATVRRLQSVRVVGGVHVLTQQASVGAAAIAPHPPDTYTHTLTLTLTPTTHLTPVAA
jgi:hypothetical protein